MEDKLNILKLFSISLRMGKIEAGPPLSTILGNLGVNTVKFCKELNEYTKDLPFYYLLEVYIIIFIDKTYEFFISEPTVALLLRLLVKKVDIMLKTSGGLKSSTIKAIQLKDIYLITYFKFGNLSKTSLTSVYGTLSSLNLHVIK